jgi:hypothetical protein
LKERLLNEIRSDSDYIEFMQIIYSEFLNI